MTTMSGENLETIADLFGEKALTVFIATISWLISLESAAFLHTLLNRLEDKGRDTKIYCSCKGVRTSENKTCNKCEKKGHPEYVGASAAIPAILCIFGLITGPTLSFGMCWCCFFYTTIRMWCYTLYPAVKRNLRTYRLEDEAREQQVGMLKLLKQNSRAYFESLETHHWYPSVTAWYQSQWGWAVCSTLFCVLLPKTSLLLLTWIWFDILFFGHTVAMQMARIDLWPLWEKAKAIPTPEQKHHGLDSVLELQNKINKLGELLQDPKYTEEQKVSLRQTESMLRAEIVAVIASVSSTKVATQ
jgi:hypothetical protein